MTATIGEAFVTIRPNTKGFDREVQTGIGGAAKTLGKFALATGAIGTAIGALSAKKFADVGKEVKGLVRTTGLSAKGASQLRYQAEALGVSTEQLGVGIKTLSTRLVAGDKSFKKFGIAVKDSKGKLLPLDESLRNISEKFKNMPAGVEKNALAVKLFGRSGLSLLPFLNKGKDGLAALSAEGAKLGVILGQKDLDAVTANVIAHRKFKAALDGLEITLGRKVLPVLTSLFTVFQDKVLPVLSRVANAISDTLWPAFEFLWGRLVSTFRPAILKLAEWFRIVRDYIENHVVPTLKKTLPDAFEKYLSPAINGIVGTLKDNLVPLLATLGGGVTIAAIVQIGNLAGAFAAIAPLVGAMISPLGLVVVAAAALAGGFAYAYKHSKTFHDFVNDKLLPGIMAVKDWVVRNWPTFKDNLIAGFQAVKDWIDKNWRPMWDGISDKFRQFVNFVKTSGLKETLISLFNNAKSAIDGTIQAIGAVFHWLQDVWNRVGHPVMLAIRGVFNELAGFIRLVLAIIRGDWGAAWDAIVQIFKGAWQIVLATLEAAWGTIRGIFNTLFGWIQRGFDNAFNAVKRVVLSFIAFFAALPGRLVGALASLGSMLLSVGVRALNSMRSGVSSGIGAVVRVIGGIPGKIITALGDVGKLLLSAGKAIIGGLVKGIQSGIPGMKTVLKGVGGIIKKVKGPPSYDKVMLFDNGSLIMQGLMDGIASQTGALKNQLGNITGTIGGMGMPSVNTAGASSGSMGATNHIEITINATDAQSVRSAIPELVSALRARVGTR